MYEVTNMMNGPRMIRRALHECSTDQVGSTGLAVSPRGVPSCAEVPPQNWSTCTSGCNTPHNRHPARGKRASHGTCLGSTVLKTQLVRVACLACMYTCTPASLCRGERFSPQLHHCSELQCWRLSAHTCCSTPCMCAHNVQQHHCNL